MSQRPSDDMANPDDTSHLPYINQGPQITPRIEHLWKIIGQQGTLRFDQIQRWAAYYSPNPDLMKQPHILSAERTRKIIRPWIDEDILQYRVFYIKQKGWAWLTSKGYKYANLNLRYYEPNPTTLPHLSAVNNIRLFVTERRPDDHWRSERELRAELPAREKGSTPPHIVDAELISTNGKNIIGIECELTIKSDKRLEEIIYDLAANKRYTTIWYFAPENVGTVVKKAVSKLPPEHRKRFVFYNLEGVPYPK